MFVKNNECKYIFKVYAAIFTKDIKMRKSHYLRRLSLEYSFILQSAFPLNIIIWFSTLILLYIYIDSKFLHNSVSYYDKRKFSS